MQDSPLPNWSIEELYRGAFRIAKKYKVLWPFGAAVGATASWNFNSSINEEDIKSFQELFNNTPSSQEVTSVLGETTSQFSEITSQIFSAIPMHYYLILGLEFFILILVVTVLSVIYRAWAESSLLHGVQTASEEKETRMRDISEKALTTIKPFIWLQVIPLLFSLFIGIMIMIPVVFLLTKQIVLQIFAGLLLFAVILIGVVGLLFITLSLIWASRIVVLEKKSAKEALKLGFYYAKKKFWHMLLLGFINTVILTIITIIGFFVPLVFLIGVIIGGVVLLKSVSSLGIILITLASIGFVLLLLGFIVFSAVTTTFKASVWSLAFNKIKK